ncbi:MAG: phosphoribosylaminoimidazolesuccinocarboxamide synthase, partial [Methanobacteriota archaeon]
RVRRVRIIEDNSMIGPKTTNYLIPLEVIARHYVAGSLNDRLKGGEVSAESLGFPRGHKPRYGEKLPRPMLEVTTKLEKVDRLLTKDEAMRISGLSEAEYREILDAVLKIDEIIGREAERRGLLHVDGKKEFAYDEARRLMVVDTFGTPDEDRFWDKARHEEGEQVELSKEVVRQHYRVTGYYDKLMESRKAKTPEPDIPALPDAVTEQVSKLYVSMFERLTGERF